MKKACLSFDTAKCSKIAGRNAFKWDTNRPHCFLCLWQSILTCNGNQCHDFQQQLADQCLTGGGTFSWTSERTDKIQDHCTICLRQVSHLEDKLQTIAGNKVLLCCCWFLTDRWEWFQDDFMVIATCQERTQHLDCVSSRRIGMIFPSATLWNKARSHTMHLRRQPQRQLRSHWETWTFSEQNEQLSSYNLPSQAVKPVTLPWSKQMSVCQNHSSQGIWISCWSSKVCQTRV